MTSVDTIGPQGPAQNETSEATSVLSTLNDDGSRRWLNPRPSPGRFRDARRVTAWVLILIFSGIPYLRMGGKPLVLLDIPTRHFTLFGKTFLPTDTLPFALLVVSIFVTVFLVTAILGRIWCGWACPQTVYMEFVYRPIQRLFEGTPGRRAKPWQGTGPAKLAKTLAYLLISLFLAHTFLAYFVGVDKLLIWVTRSPIEHPTGFIVVMVVTAAMMFDFTYFREQTCIVACPYGRFQAVMLDRQSMIVGYDPRRGEPRGKPGRRPKGVSLLQPAQPGDCVDCGMCVTTCPTGIDIRNGLQMECVGCAQCIDACDAVMEKIGKPRGLVRYSSQSLVTGEGKHVVRPRVVVYFVVLGVLLAGFVAVLLTSPPLDVRVTRGPGAPFTALEGGKIITNLAAINLSNRREQPVRVTIEARQIPGARIVGEDFPVRLEIGQVKRFPVTLQVPREAFDVRGPRLILHISDDAGFSKDVEFRLMGPASGGAGGGR